MNHGWIAALFVSGGFVAPAAALSPAVFDRTIDLRFETADSTALLADERLRLGALVSEMESRGECAVDYVLIAGTRRAVTAPRKSARKEFLMPQNPRERYLSDLLKQHHLGNLIFDVHMPADLSPSAARLMIHGYLRQAPCEITAP